jgi:aerobic-type carbon monoxide dehydrogenase small subunit (CoxS/CutS family)
MQLNVNAKLYEVDSDPDTPLLWVLRDAVGLTGTKFGCGVGVCGACSVLLDGQVTRSCLFPVAAVGSKVVTTIEGIGAGHEHPLQAAWITAQVPQCGYCQSGMLVAAAALLAKNPNPSDAEIDAAVTNLCRCGTYPRIRSAIHLAARNASGNARAER